MSALEFSNPKEAAIASLLPLLWVHLDLLPMRIKIQRYGDSTVEPREPLPGWRTLDCDGLCIRCEWAKSCKGEWWAVVKEKMRRRYRLRALERSMDELFHVMPQAWRALVALYVDPYDEASEPLDEWHKERREDWARKGVEFMANEIPGDLVPFGEQRRTCHEIVADMLERGMSYKYIEREMGVSSKTIARISRALRERSERTLSAAGIDK